MQDENFEWDDEKSRTNLSRHKISFEIAKRVFDDSAMVDELDETMDYGEDRYRAIGLIESRILTVIYTLRDARVRIISARKATRKEQDRYANKNQSP